MPSDDYASFGGGALKLKGAKVKKHKKKRKDKGSDLEKALSTGETSSRTGGEGPERERRDREDGEEGKELRSRSSSHGEEKEESDGGDANVSYKTEAERRFEEAKRKKVRTPTSLTMMKLLVSFPTLFPALLNILIHGNSSWRCLSRHRHGLSC